jgi:molybdopterin molybdotransferase
MITFEEAQAITVKYRVNRGAERVMFIDSLNRVLAEDIASDMDMPPFNKTAVDGFACRLEDIGMPLKINEVIPAGKVPEKEIRKGECARIMTGAAVPDGADYVFMVEDSVEDDGFVRFTGKFNKDNIAKKGEDIKTGDIVLKKGRIVRPQDIAVMATVGAAEVMVSVKPSVAVISTGSELVEPQDRPGKGQIRNSNAYQLIAQVIRSGADAIYYGIAKDNEKETFEIVTRAIRECDIVIMTGGVSMGDFDFVPKVLQDAGVKILFDSVAVQPGKPTTFGVCEDAFIFGLPGNPVSSFVQFELLVRPMIQVSMNSDWRPEVVTLPLAVDYRRKRTDRLNWIPVIKDAEGKVAPVDFHGSAHINALPDSFGITGIPVGVANLAKGELVDVRQI